ncbi:MAG: IclR family transcriptional regulator [Provencibacterium sp.]|jgi:DNA-binding IclR family transcriptional regulator|nr:IclR family transcriptional regulator [Provencibacterium sp.]
MAAKDEKRTQSNQSSEKLLVILEALAAEPEPIGLQELARRLSVNSSTLLRFLTTLQRRGYVAQERDGRYLLTLKLCALAEQITGKNRLQDLCAPYLRELNRIFSASAILSVEQEGQVFYLDVVNETSRILTTVQRVGHLADMHCTGSGKLFLQNASPEELNSFFKSRKLEQKTPYTLTRRAELMAELEAVRARGYATDEEEATLGVRCVAAPVYDYTGKVAAAISISGPCSQLTPELIREKLPLLLDAARQVSFCLGYAQADTARLGADKEETADR